VICCSVIAKSRKLEARNGLIHNIPEKLS